MSSTVNVNAYLTPARSQGFPVHFDPHDVFILQTEGSKEWFIYEPNDRLPVEPSVLSEPLRQSSTGLSEDDLELIEQCTLKKGDFLYIPRGFPHKAVSADEPSLHLTVSFHPLYWLDFLKTAIEVASFDSLQLRRSLPYSFASDTEVQREMKITFRSILQGLAETASFGRTLEALTRLRINRSGYPPDGHFIELLRLQEINPASVVERRTGMPCVVECSDKKVSIRFATNEIQGPPVIKPMLEHIRDHKRFKVSELPGPLDEKSKIVLIRRLVGEGLLRTVLESQVHTDEL